MIIFALVPMGIAMALFSVIKIDFVKLLSNLGKLLLVLGTLAGVFALIKFIGSKFEATIITDILLLTAIPFALNMFVRSLRIQATSESMPKTASIKIPTTTKTAPVCLHAFANVGQFTFFSSDTTSLP